MTFLCYVLVIVSFFVMSVKQIKLPETNQVTENVTIYGNYTGLSMHTFRGNLYSHFGEDYSSGMEQNFLTVFAVLFSSVTGEGLLAMGFAKKGNNYGVRQGHNYCNMVLNTISSTRSVVQCAGIGVEYYTLKLFF